MATTTTKPQQRNQTSPPAQNAVAVLAAPRLLPPEDKVLAEYDVNREGWRTLTESIFPAAKTVTSVMMALDYCKRRKLDVFKHPVHIVPIWNSQAGENGKGAMVETIWPGINELRTTAIRTGQYAGMDVPVFGPSITETFEGKIKKWKNNDSYYETETAEVTYPEWCQITVFRLLGGNRVPFPGPRVYWVETYARIKSNVDIPNSMWQNRPNGQLEKCAEAAALRRAFPEELGSDYSIDEIGAFTTHAPTDVTGDGSATTAPAEPKRGDFTSPPADSPPGGGNGQPASGDAAGADGDRKPEAASTPAPITDVPDLNEPPTFTFEHYKTVKPFVDFSEHFLNSDGNNANGAGQWLAFYRDDVEKTFTNPKCTDKVRTAMEMLVAMAEERMAPPREPGEEG